MVTINQTVISRDVATLDFGSLQKSVGWDDPEVAGDMSILLEMFEPSEFAHNLKDWIDILDHLRSASYDDIYDALLQYFREWLNELDTPFPYTLFSGTFFDPTTPNWGEIKRLYHDLLT